MVYGHGSAANGRTCSRLELAFSSPAPSRFLSSCGCLAARVSGKRTGESPAGAEAETLVTINTLRSGGGAVA